MIMSISSQKLSFLNVMYNFVVVNTEDIMFISDRVELCIYCGCRFSIHCNIFFSTNNMLLIYTLQCFFSCANYILIFLILIFSMELFLKLVPSLTF